MHGTTWRDLALGLAVVAAAAAPGAACDLAAHPSVTINVANPGPDVEILSQDPCAGITKILVPEGAKVELTASAVDDGGGCTPIPWSGVVQVMTSQSDTNMKLDEVFDDAYEFVSFIQSDPQAAGGHGLGPPFQYSVGQGASILPPGVPASGGEAEFFDLIDQVLSGNLVSGYSMNPGGSVRGRFGPDIPNIRVGWYVLADGALHPDIPGSPPQTEIGVNPRVPAGGPQWKGPDGKMELFFDTPNFRGDDPETAAWYAVFARAALPFLFQPGAGFSATFCQDQHIDEDGVAGNDDDDDGTPGTDPMSCQGSYPFEVDFSGIVVKETKPAGTSTVGVDGHPALALIAVEDVTPPLGAWTEDTDLGETVSGQPLANGDVTIEMVDNNPYGEAQDYSVEAWYLVERSHWQGGPGTPFEGLRHDPLAHGMFGDDCFAGSPGHEFRWAYLGAQQATGVTRLPESGGPRRGVRVEFPSFSVIEPVGTHWAIGSEAGPYHTPYVNRGLKLAYRVSQEVRSGVFSRPEGVPAEEPGFAAVAPWGDTQENLYVSGSGTAEPTPDDDGVNAATLASVCGSCAGFELVGVPTWEVRDELPPSLVILAHDTKYDKWYYFGENFAGDAYGNGGYLSAYETGQGGPFDFNNAIEPFEGRVEFDEHGDDEGFENQIGAYESDFWPANAGAGIGENAGTYAGLWIDEDTRVEFFVTAWDNINGWVMSGAGAGIDAVEVKLVDEPSSFEDSRTFASVGESMIHLFRNPNRPEALRGDLGEAYVRAETRDKEGNPRAVQVQIYIADNSLKIYSLEEHRRRLSND